jgi:8-oxo-dGTP diphosphatase
MSELELQEGTASYSADWQIADAHTGLGAIKCPRCRKPVLDGPRGSLSCSSCGAREDGSVDPALVCGLNGEQPRGLAELTAERDAALAGEQRALATIQALRLAVEAWEAGRDEVEQLAAEDADGDAWNAEEARRLRGELASIPRVGVAVIVRRADGRILIGKRNDGTWGVPSGKLERGESLLACAAREIEEETGLRLTSIRSTGLWTHDFGDAHLQDYATLWTIVDVDAGTPVALMEPDKCSEWRWASQLDCQGNMFRCFRTFMQNGHNPWGIR